MNRKHMRLFYKTAFWLLWLALTYVATYWAIVFVFGHILKLGFANG